MENNWLNLFSEFPTISSFFNDMECDGVDVMKYDFNKKEDVESFCKLCNELKENRVFSALVTLLCNESVDDCMDSLIDKVQKYYENSKKNESIEDKSAKELPANEESKQIITDHEDISVNTKLQIHKLVQEYIDTEIKPKVKDLVSTNELNDAYAAFYDYSCWLMTHK